MSQHGCAVPRSGVFNAELVCLTWVDRCSTHAVTMPSQACHCSCTHMQCHCQSHAVHHFCCNHRPGFMAIVFQKQIIKNVEKRGTKGRKVRFDTHDKLINFKAPKPITLPDYAESLFRSLFGNAVSTQPVTAVA